MPIQMPTSKWDPAPPTPPRPIAWIIAFIFIVACWGVYLLTSWPIGKTSSTFSLFSRLLVPPALAWSFLFGFRLHYYEQELLRQQADHDILQEDQSEAIRFAQEPLAVIDSAYRCALGHTYTASKIAQQQRPIMASRPKTGKVAIRHTSLRQFEKSNLDDRYEACINDLLEQLGDVLRRLPASVLFEAYVQCPDGLTHEQIRIIWRRCWANDRRPVEIRVLSTKDGMLLLDRWLDEYGGCALEKFVLIVAVQLYGKPPVDTAEAGSALLLGWAPLVKRHGISIQALLHRPVDAECGATIDALSSALLWGTITLQQLKGLWLAGATQFDKTVLQQAIGNDVQIDVHDIDLAIGTAGAASTWLATTFAIEHAAHTGSPQLMASRQHTLRLAVINPLVSA